MSKTPEMIDTLDRISMRMFGRKRSEMQTSGVCVACGEPATEFTDAISETEYGISGFCQTCQDLTFGGAE